MQNIHNSSSVYRYAKKGDVYEEVLISNFLPCYNALVVRFLSLHPAFDSSNYASSNSSAVAQSQYEMLMDSFGFDSSLSDIVYPSNYGGAYINSEGALVVMQTNSISSSSRGGNFASVLNEAGSFILDTVSYSYNELNSLKSEIDDACLSFQSNPSAFSDDQANLLNSISFFYISQKDNSIIVGITDLNDSKRNSFLDMFGASDAYMLIEGLHTTTTASLKPGGDIVRSRWTFEHRMACLLL